MDEEDGIFIAELDVNMLEVRKLGELDSEL